MVFAKATTRWVTQIGVVGEGVLMALGADVQRRKSPWSPRLRLLLDQKCVSDVSRWPPAAVGLDNQARTHMKGRM